MQRKITLEFDLEGEDAGQRYADIFHMVWMIAEAAQLGSDFIVKKDKHTTKTSLKRRWAQYKKGSRWA